MRIFRIIFILVAVFVIASCSKDYTGRGTLDSDYTALSSKFINNPTIDSPFILIKLGENADAQSVENLLIAGVDSVVKVFNSVPGKEALEKECGLDRWFEVYVNPDLKETKSAGSGLNSLALALSELKEVAIIQFPTKAESGVKGEAIPYNQAAPSATQRVFNDPMLPLQWSYLNTGSSTIDPKAKAGADINVTDVWAELTTGDPQFVIAVLDEGVMYSHPDLAANMWTNTAELNGLPGVDDDGNGYVDDIYGCNAVTKDGNITWDKDKGHGTHCAGVIAGVSNNGIGISGIAGGSGSGDGCRIMSCQIFDSHQEGGGGLPSQTARAFKYAADNGASIASCSWGVKAQYNTDNAYIEAAGVEYDAIRYFERTVNNSTVNGGLVIFASGNYALSFSSYPGALHDIISVTAIGPDGLPTYYTNYGPGCNIAAPGGEFITTEDSTGCILSTLPPEFSKGTLYGYMQGTSMACPHVSGIAALGLSYAKKLGNTYTLNEFKDMILTSVTNFDNLLEGNKVTKASTRIINLNYYKKRMGTGLTDTWQFMMKIEGTPSLVAKIGSRQAVDVSSYFGVDSENITFTSVQVNNSSMKLAEAPFMENGKLYIYPTVSGSAKLTIRAIAGGDKVGGGDVKGGKAIEQVVSVVSKHNVSTNGGWL
ncbi:MAG: S8 family serine peptidase [Bacteroidales bacterium]|nr:S8 family serine peptidase [Bacteroidales bacterium]